LIDNKGLVPEGYVRFLNGDEERQYLAQSPPSNTLLPRNPTLSSGEDTPRQPQTTQPLEQEWNTHPKDDEEWVDDPEDAKGGWEVR